MLADGDKVVAGGLTLRVVLRPGHSTSDTLFVDEESDEAFVGDHLLAEITSGAEIMPTELPGRERRRSLLEYLGNLRKTEAMGLATCYPGHGPMIDDHRALIATRLAFHAERLDRIAELVRDGCATAFEIARRPLVGRGRGDAARARRPGRSSGTSTSWSTRGTVREDVDPGGSHRFAPKEAGHLAARTS